MNLSKGFNFLVVVLFTALTATFAVGAGTAAAAQSTSGLGNADCAKCHAKQATDIDAKGMAHKTSIGCQDCHVGHPPTVNRKDIIPKCSMCHTDKPHYKLPNCLACHRNPHTPKVITFGKDVTDACLSCHTQQIAKLKDNPSKHTKLNCSFCHDIHGKIPLCTQCHKPHSSNMVAADCKKCHQAHAPKAVTYAADTPNKFCSACHVKTNSVLTASKAKHGKFLCVSCHQNKHKATPKCQDCHAKPHPAGIMAKFPVCGTCHNIAHDLNNWPVTEKKQETPAKPAKRAKKK